MIIADTGFWLALANRKDQYHQLAINKLNQLKEPLITTHPVITETCYLLLNKLGNYAQCSFIEMWESGAFQVFELNQSHANRIKELMEKYVNLPMDLADASLIILSEHLGHGRILTVDQRDFAIYRWKNQYPFDNILFS
jgi:predicted nucleic acid-binding protein